MYSMYEYLRLYVHIKKKWLKLFDLFSFCWREYTVRIKANKIIQINYQCRI